MRVPSAASLCFVMILWGCTAASGAAAQDIPCPGGRVVTGFQLSVAAPGQPGEVPFSDINNLDTGDVLHYAPAALPKVWKDSSRIATILIPAAYDASAQLTVFTGHADKPASWTVPSRIGAVAFLFGPNGLNAKKTRSLLSEHPELVLHFISYAEETSRVEALVALLARYENSPPGSLDLNTLLKQYSAAYGVTMPKANPALPPDQEAAVLLAAVAPPTANPNAPNNNSLTAGSTSTATALASLYFGPEMGLATDTLPLFHALHQSLFPGTQFQGAFAQAGSGPSRLCAANTAPPPNQHTVYIWMSNLPGGSVPVVKLAQSQPAVVPAGAKSTITVTCASVAQLRNLGRARQWRLEPAAGGDAAPVPVSVEVAAGPLRDTLTLDLSHAAAPSGDYRLVALWDWTPVEVQGAVAVRPPTPLADAKLAEGDAASLISGGNEELLTVTGGDFSFVNKVELIGAAPSAPDPLPFTLAKDRQSLSIKVAAAKLAPGVYQLRLDQSAGGPRSLPLTVQPPNPTLEAVRANLDEGSQRVTLHGRHLDRIERITSPQAIVTLAPVPASVPPEGLEQRAAVIALSPSAAAGQHLSADVYVAGRPNPLPLGAAIHVLGARPKIAHLNQTVNAGQTVALVPGELPADATVNFAFTVRHAPAATAIQVSCQSPDEQVRAVTLHPGESSGTQELDAGGNGLFYLAAVPGKIGSPGCRLRMTVADPVDGDSDPYDLGRIVQLPRIVGLTLSNQSPAPGQFAGELRGDNLQLIAKTGWNADTGIPVTSVPMRVGTTSPTQTLAIVMPWPPPSPHAPLYIWLRGETHGRATTVNP